MNYNNLLYAQDLLIMIFLIFGVIATATLWYALKKYNH